MARSVDYGDGDGGGCGCTATVEGLHAYSIYLSILRTPVYYADGLNWDGDMKQVRMGSKSGELDRGRKNC